LLLSLDTRSTALNIVSEGNRMNLFTQQFPTEAVLLLTEFLSTHTLLMGEWPQRQLIGFSVL
ncbi:hypothetical protein QIG64_27725, partial [Klebsiella pneumoniae]|nr:hypothetical protein [Klebsiella pneumoniae]